MTTSVYEKYLRKDKMPHIWCSGCGNGTAMNALILALDSLKIEKDNVTMVSGIGCSSRTPGYLDFNTLHTTHGRAIPFATGVKMVNPKMNVIVISGDGDAMAIGGNHFIHGARRNIDLTVIILNNFIYGMTGGQYSPTTPEEALSTTTPYGNFEPSFDICRLAEAAGASFVARGTTYHVVELEEIFRQAILKKGFSVVEVICQCPTSYGRKNKLSGGLDMVKWAKDHSFPVEAARNLEPEALAGKFLVGVLVNRNQPEYTAEYEKLIARLQREAQARGDGHGRPM